MLSIPSGIQELVDQGRFELRWMMRVDLDSGATGIWNDTFPLTHESVTYGPLAGNMDFDAIPGSGNLSSDRVQLTVTNLLPAVATIIATEDWHQRPATIYLAVLNDAGNAQYVTPRFSGFLDEIELSDATDDLVKITFTIESNNRELGRSSNAVRSDASQRRRNPTDGFFKHAAAANADTNITWGRNGTQKPKVSGFAKFLGKIF